MSQDYQKKLESIGLAYPDKELPISARYTLSLLSDLHDMVSTLTGRVAMLEFKLDQVDQKLGNLP